MDFKVRLIDTDDPDLGLRTQLHFELKSINYKRFFYHFRLAKSTLDFKDNSQPLAVEILGRLPDLAIQYPQCIGNILKGAEACCSQMRDTLLIPTRSCFYMPGGPLRTTLIGHTGKDHTALDISDNYF